MAKICAQSQVLTAQDAEGVRK